MPYKRKDGAKKAAKRRAAGKKIYRRRRISPAQTACVIETNEVSLMSNSAYSLYNLNLSQFPRAISVAKSYQFFRIKKVEFFVKPVYDTFDANGATRVPHLYYMMDRVKQLQFFNSYTQLEKLGAKPHRLDDKIIKFGFTPSVLNAVVDLQSPNPTQFDQYKLCPWLNCRDMTSGGGIWNPNGVDHGGCVWIVSNSGANNIPFIMERRVTIEFKKPASDITLTEGTPAIEPWDLEVETPLT